MKIKLFHYACWVARVRLYTRIMIKLRKYTDKDEAAVVDVWCRSVDATHHFLSDHDRKEIESEVIEFLPKRPLMLAVNTLDRPIGFMFVHEGHMEALFIDPDFRGCGVGRKLVEYALTENPKLTTDVNEQNEQAVGFYKRLGFEETGRSPRDDQGRAYPLIHMSFKKGVKSS